MTCLAAKVQPAANMNSLRATAARNPRASMKEALLSHKQNKPSAHRRGTEHARIHRRE
jgi:hypothetical protein